MKAFKTIALISCALCMTACAQKQDKKSYTLGDNTLHTYSPGDSLVYSIVSGTRSGTSGVKEFLGEVAVNWSASTYTSFPDGSNTTGLSNGVIETTTLSTSDQNDEITQRYYFQDKDGSVYLYLLETSNNTVLWVKVKDQNTFSVNTIVSPLVPEQMISPQFDVYTCNPICTQVGSGGEEITYVGVETITTPLAEFESYAFSYSYNLSISDTTLGLSALKTITGKKWIYPPLGTVMYSASINDSSDANALYYVAAAQRTNIKLPEP